MDKSILKAVAITVALVLALSLPFALQWKRNKMTAITITMDVPAPDILTKHTQEFDKPEIIKVTDGIYMAIGYALANAILIEAPEGNIVVDTTETYEGGKLIRQSFKEVSDRPIVAIIYTHNHPDHTFGAKAFVDDLSNPPDIWAHHTLPNQIKRITVNGPLIYRRSIKQFGRFIPNLVNSGIGPRLVYDKDAAHGILPPNKFLYEDQMDVKIAGLQLRLVHIPGETPDQIGVWIPDAEAFLCADDLYRAFPNLYAIRGTPARDVMNWATSLDKILALKPMHLVPSHTKPLEGKAYIKEVVTSYRDAIQFVHDQTVRLMNKGLHPNDIVRMIKLPQRLQSHPFLQEFYGTVEWSVRGVFDSYMGWFSGDISELSPLGTQEKAEKMIDLAGGIDMILKKAKTAFENEEFQWCLELVSAVLKLSSDNSRALSLRTQTLRKLASQHTSAGGRNFHLMSALEDHGLVDSKLDSSLSFYEMPMLNILHSLSAKMNPDTCHTEDSITLLNLTDTKQVYNVHLRNGVFVVKEGASLDWTNHYIETTQMIAKEIIGKKTKLMDAHKNGKAVIKGISNSFLTLLRCFDED